MGSVREKIAALKEKEKEAAALKSAQSARTLHTGASLGSAQFSRALSADSGFNNETAQGGAAESQPGTVSSLTSLTSGAAGPVKNSEESGEEAKKPVERKPSKVSLLAAGFNKQALAPPTPPAVLPPRPTSDKILRTSSGNSTDSAPASVTSSQGSPRSCSPQPARPSKRPSVDDSEANSGEASEMNEEKPSSGQTSAERSPETVSATANQDKVQNSKSKVSGLAAKLNLNGLPGGVPFGVGMPPRPSRQATATAEGSSEGGDAKPAEEQLGAQAEAEALPGEQASAKESPDKAKSEDDLGDGDSKQTTSQETSLSNKSKVSGLAAKLGLSALPGGLPFGVGMPPKALRQTPAPAESSTVEQESEGGSEKPAMEQPAAEVVEEPKNDEQGSASDAGSQSKPLTHLTASRPIQHGRRRPQSLKSLALAQVAVHERPRSTTGLVPTGRIEESKAGEAGEVGLACSEPGDGSSKNDEGIQDISARSDAAQEPNENSKETAKHDDDERKGEETGEERGKEDDAGTHGADDAEQEIACDGIKEPGVGGDQLGGESIDEDDLI